MDLIEAIAEVSKEHTKINTHYGDFCIECGERWPCATAIVLEAAGLYWSEAGK